MNHQLTVKHHLLVIAPPLEAEVLLPECVEHATHVVDQLETVQGDGSLVYLHDAGATTLSHFGLIMYKASQGRRLSRLLENEWSNSHQLFWRLESRGSRQHIIDLGQRVHDCCTRVDEGIPLAYIARFFDRVLGLFRSAEVDVAGPGANVSDWVAGQAEQQTDLVSSLVVALTKQDEFLRLTAGGDLGQLLVDDDYW